MKPHWQPGIPLRFVPREGRKILQQVWLRYGPGYDKDGSTDWKQTGDFQWRDVPMGPQTDNPMYWCEEERL
jgi:hypothetical protein